MRQLGEKDFSTTLIDISGVKNSLLVTSHAMFMETTKI